MADDFTCKKCGDSSTHYGKGKCERCWRADYNRRWMRDKRKRQKEEAAKS